MEPIKKPQQPGQAKHKNLGKLILLVVIVLAWIVTPMLMGMQESAALEKQQAEQRYNSLKSSLETTKAQEVEYNSKTSAERLKIIGAIPEKDKLSQSNILREVEGILSGTNAQIRSISFDTANYTSGSGPRAVPLTLELASQDAGTILQVLKKFEDANRLYREEGITLGSTDSGVNAQIRLSVYSRK